MLAAQSMMIIMFEGFTYFRSFFITPPTSPSHPGTVLVTGASSGIGATYAKRLAARGYDLILAARRAERMNQLASALRSAHGVHVDVQPADLSRPDDQGRIAQQIESDASITFVVNNAGVATFAPVGKSEVGVLDEMTDLNVSALVRPEACRPRWRGLASQCNSSRPAPRRRTSGISRACRFPPSMHPR